MKKALIISCIICAAFLFSCSSDDSDDDCYGADARCASTSQCCDGLSCQTAELPGILRCK